MGRVGPRRGAQAWSARAFAATMVAAVLVAACAGRLPAPGEPSVPVWVVGHGWHVGLAVRTGDVRADVWPEAAALSSLRFVEVGWGDGEFYPAERGTVSLAVSAAVWSASSVLHVAAFDREILTFFPASPVVELALTRAGFDDLCRFIASAYARDAAGRPRRVAPGLYGSGAFYAADERYHLFNNSNQWAARALRAGGVPLVPALSLYGATVMGQAARFGIVRRPTDGTGVP